MTEVRISFSFYVSNNRRVVMENSVRHQMRKMVAEMMRDSGFGAVQEADDDKFVNEYAIPLQDQYYDMDAELFIVYSFVWPLHDGNYARLVSEGIPNLIANVNNEHHIHVISRVNILS